MSSRVEIQIKAVDEASKTIAQVGQTTEEAIKKVEDANQRVDRASREATGSVRDLITGFSGLATSAFALYSAIDKVQDMQVSLSRANLQVQTSLNAVEDAQRRYNAVVEKYGIDSEQAREALKDLQIAQERYQVAVERAQVIQGNINEAMVQSALVVVPTLITAIDAGIKAFQNLEAGVKAVNMVMSFLAANPVVAVIMAIGILITVLYTAYQTCEPFRDAVNALGSALMNVLKPAIEAIINALTWLWNNVIKPVADAFGWFVGVIKGAFQALTGASEQAKVETSQDLQEIRTQAVSMGQTVTISTRDAGSSVQNFATTVRDSERIATTSFANISSSAKNMADEVYKGYTKIADGVWVATDALERAAMEYAKKIGEVWDKLEAHAEKAAKAARGGGKSTPEWPGQPTGKQYGSLGGVPASTTPTTPAAPPFKLEPVQTIGGLTVMKLVEGQFGFEGMVGRPTLFLAGEAGPEYVSIRPEGRGAGINIRGPLINIEGSADERTVAKAVKEIERILRSVILEATSSNAPNWSKRIRFGGAW